MRKIQLFIYCSALSIIQVVQGQSKSWQLMNKGLTNSMVNAISIDQDGYIYAGTENGGLYKSNNIIDAIEKPTKALPDKFFISQNYPNPFNPSTNISYSLPADGNVSLKIYDALGREASTLIDKFQKAGYHNLTFDASQLSSGIYFYRLIYSSADSKNNYTAIKKMILIR